MTNVPTWDSVTTTASRAPAQTELTLALVDVTHHLAQVILKFPSKRIRDPVKHLHAVHVTQELVDRARHVP